MAYKPVCLVVMIAAMAALSAQESVLDMLVPSAEIPETPDMSRLIQDLVERNPERQRPVRDASENITVLYALAPRRIMLDDHRQEMSMDAWSFMSWRDEFLQWVPDSFGGIEKVHLNPEDLWLPDIAVYNRLFDSTETPFRKVPVLVTSEGNVMWFPPTHTKVPCNLNLLQWPHDQHNCSVKLGSWSHHGEQIDLQIMTNGSGILVENYIEGNDWRLAGHSGVRRVQQINSDMHVDISLYFQLQRMATDQIGYIFPAYIVAMLSTICSFFFPYARYSGRLACHFFSLAVLIACLFLLYASLPSIGGPLPHIVVYFRGSIAITCISLLLNLVICNLSCDDSWVYDAFSALGRSAKKDQNYAKLRNNTSIESLPRFNRNDEVTVSIESSNGGPPQTTDQQASNNSSSSELTALHQKKLKEMIIVRYMNGISLILITTIMLVDFVTLYYALS